MLAFVLLLFAASTALAQEWQWWSTGPRWRNPSGFPANPMFVCDVDGDGTDEIFSLTDQTLYVSLLFPTGDTTLRWFPEEAVGLALGSSHFVDAENLDSVAGDEIIARNDIGFQCFGYDGASHSWSARPELPAVLPSTQIIGPSNGLLFGDYDGDELLEAVSLTSWADTLMRFERNANGVWEWVETLGISYGFSWYGEGFYDGDFDHDGDVDLGLLMGVPADPSDGVTLMLENVNGQFLFPDTEWMSWPHLTTGLGGDLDGDGDWEGLNAHFNRYGLYLAGTTDGPQAGSLGVDDTFCLTPFEGSLLGWLRFSGTPALVGFESLTYWQFPGGSVYYTMQYTGNGWIDRPTGFWDWYLSECTHAVLADFDLDGRKDILAVTTPHYWRLWQNDGNEASDHFAQRPSFTMRRFESNPDTAFSQPVLGQFVGDERLELAAIAQPTGEAPRVVCFETSGSFADTSMLPLPDLTAGLPQGVTRIHAVDLDADGMGELLLFTDHWELFFRRSGQWESYINILPNITSTIRGFADWNGDGTTDIFTDQGVFLNLSPSPVDEPIFTPSSFSLSVFPNPFNAQTTISFDLPREGIVKLSLFNITGRNIATLLDENLSAGSHTLNYNAVSLPSGMYFARMEATGLTRTTKMLLLR